MSKFKTLLNIPILQNVRSFHTTNSCMEIRKMARLRVVDNSEIGKTAMAEGKPPRCIHVYNKKSVGKIGNNKLLMC